MDQPTKPSIGKWIAIGASAIILGVLAVFLAPQVLDPADRPDPPTEQISPVTNLDNIEPSSEIALSRSPEDIPGVIGRVLESLLVVSCEGSDYEGSGFVLDTTQLTGRSGVVLVTNHHVIEECAREGDVIVNYRGQRFSGPVLSFDKARDLAILNIQDFSAPALTPNYPAETGWWVMAVGSPLGVRESASFGYITGFDEAEQLLTSDAVIGPGNSGGPLVTNAGQVVGVNTAVWEQATGISLAAPIEALCRKILDCD